MADYLRIVDRFKITGRGFVYTVNVSHGSVVRINDTFMDLRGNHFKVTGMEMIRRLRIGIPYVDDSIGLLFELVDGVEAYGNILVRELSEICFLFCNHPLNPGRVDEDFEQEYQDAGLNHSCALFSYDDLEKGTLKLYGENISGLTVYRGWMMKPELYRRFYELLEEKNITLINSPYEYECYHTLPGWYADFEKETVQSVWETEGSVKSALRIAERLEGSFIVKDYVKSRKHEWYDACFIQNISDVKYARRIITNFVDRQGDSLVGGIVLSKYVALKQIGFHEKNGMPIAEEYRVFIFAGRVMIMDDYWHTDVKVGLSEQEFEWVNALATRVKSNFVTMDIARKEDGSLVIMEFGDGQVSGLQQIQSRDFYSAFDGKL